MQVRVQAQTQPGFSWVPRREAPRPHRYSSNRDTTFHKVIRLSQRGYDEFIAQEETRGLCQRRSGVECRQGSRSKPLQNNIVSGPLQSSLQDTL